MPNCRLLVALLVLALPAAIGCKSGETPRANKTAAPAAPATVAAAAAAQPAATAEVPSPAQPAAPEGTTHMEWKGGVDWHSWEEAQALSKQQSKPIMVLLYADWCPHCRALAPAFSEASVKDLASHFVMVRQNSDDDPAWLEPYKKYGGYVPRIFFFDQKGQMREDIVSGHPRYPYFYAAEHIDFLKQSMRRVIGS